METQKAAAIKWFAEKIKDTPSAKLWLASSGAIITGSPIHPTEYFQTIFGNPETKDSTEIENVLALKDVQIKQSNNTINVFNVFNVALVDLNLIVAWGGYDPATSYSAGPDQTLPL